MPMYIDADKIISYLNDEIESCGGHDVDYQPVTYGTYLGLKYAKSLVETAETTDVQEVRHGKWEKSLFAQDFFRCSFCSAVWNRKFEYCPHCGAKMNGGKKQDDNHT